MIGVAIIGCGRIAGHHCRAILKNKFLKLIAVCDINKERARSYAEKYSVKSYNTYDEMINENMETISLVAIMTPSGLHYHHAKQIINKYKKNLIIEKPTFLKTSHANLIYKLAKKYNLSIFPIFQNRFNKAVKFVKKDLISEDRSNIMSISVRVRWNRPQRYYDMDPWRGTFSLDGGCLSNQGIHHLDLLRYLFGDVKKVFFKLDTLGSNIEVEDTAMGIIEFNNGIIGNLEITTAARPKDFEASISILTKDNFAEIGGIAVNEIKEYTKNPKIIKKYSEDFSTDVYGKGHFELYDSIVNNLLNNKPYLISKNDLVGTISFLNACYQSNRLSKFVKVKNCKDFQKLGAFNKKLFSVYNTNK